MDKIPAETIQKILFFVYRNSLIYNENFLENALICKNFYSAIYDNYFIKNITFTQK